MIALLFLFILFILLQNASQNQGVEISLLGYKTKYFHISDGASKSMYENMKKDGVSTDSLKLFVTMEDRFLKLEQMAVCSGVARRNEGYGLSDQIKEEFVAYNFSYHVSHLKQMSEPHKLINRNITC
jgi:hypothetical protein